MRTRRFIQVLFALIFALSGSARAHVPSQFTVQGVLRDGTGALQSTTVTYVIRIWQSQASMDPADLLFTYAPAPPGNTVMSSNGLFTIGVTLAPADISKITGALGNASITSLWLEVTANGYTYSRQPLTEVMSAIFADRLSPNCSGCVADSMIASGVSASKISGTLDVAHLAQPPGGKTNDPSATPYTKLTSNYAVVSSVTVTVPGPGVILGTATGQLRVWRHNQGTFDAITCSLDAPALGNFTPMGMLVPAPLPSWGTEGVAFSQTAAASQIFPVTAAGTYTVELRCKIDNPGSNAGCPDVNLGGTIYGCDVLYPVTQAVYLPKAY